MNIVLLFVASAFLTSTEQSTVSRKDTPDGLQSVSEVITCVITTLGQARIKDSLEFRASRKMCMLNVLITAAIKRNFVIRFIKFSGN